MPETLGTMLSDILNSLVHKPVTTNYPAECCDEPIRTRGKVVYNAETCTGCRLCVRDCPANAIDIIILDRKEKRFVMHYHVDRCIFCGQCVESCRFDCITLTDTQWELASTSKNPFDLYYGNDEDVKKVLDKHTEIFDVGT
ncbi:MAG: 4Fe-4S binding protein [Anaerolineae bacterium]|nr:4Fe-4S binding protein [Anaerolineae bacterium]